MINRPLSIHLPVDILSQSVNQVTQKTVKLDPDAYKKLNSMKKLLKKYLQRSLSNGDTIRWLILKADQGLGELAVQARSMEVQKRYAILQEPGGESNFSRYVKEDLGEGQVIAPRRKST